MKIVSIQVGRPREIEFRGKPMTTSIFKSAVQKPVRVGKTNIEGDEQSDLRVHGGPDKAVYAYSFAAYDWWKKNRSDLSLENGAFGENLTLDDIDENRIFIGDSFVVGQAILQVAQPRFPCGKLGAKFNDLSVIKSFTQSRRPGVYFRVLQEGIIQKEDEFKLISQEKIAVSVNEIFELNQQARVSPKRVQEILQLQSLPESWRQDLQELLNSPQ